MKTGRQKGLILMVSERFLEEIDAAYPKLGYDSRASFVRDAVYKELARKGVEIPAEYKVCPGTGNKRGRPKKIISPPG
jgi:hypothetical protein